MVFGIVIVVVIAIGIIGLCGVCCGMDEDYD